MPVLYPKIYAVLGHILRPKIETVICINYDTHTHTRTLFQR